MGKICLFAKVVVGSGLFGGWRGTLTEGDSPRPGTRTRKRGRENGELGVGGGG